MAVLQIQKYWKGLCHYFFPDLCLSCQKPLIAQESFLCLECLYNIPKVATVNGVQALSQERINGIFQCQHIFCYAYFEEKALVQKIIHQIKYQSQEALALFMGKQMAYALQNQDWIKTIEAVVPVPIHPHKEKMRGYNQSALLAKSIATVLQLPLVENVLIKAKENESQTHKSRVERALNLQETFQVQHQHRLENKHLLLVDDVLTTGATLTACAQQLSLIQGVKISACNLALVL